MPHAPRPRPSLLSQRTAFVLLLALLAACAVAVLTWLRWKNTPEAILAGLGVLGGGLRFFDWLIT